MEWKLKENIEKQGSSDGFWYDLTNGGYINIDEILADECQIKELKKAVDLVCSFETMLENNDLLEEF